MFWTVFADELHQHHLPLLLVENRAAQMNIQYIKHESVNIIISSQAAKDKQSYVYTLFYKNLFY